MSRGLHPADARLFAPGVVPVLRRAAEEVAWLLGRGYSPSTAVAAAGAHHQLEVRQRVALSRSAASDADRDARLLRLRPTLEARGERLQLDGFNVLIALEVALSGGVLLKGREGALRDLAGLRGSYHLIDETERALALLGDQLRGAPPAHAHFFLDERVSNSGRLRSLIRARAASWPFPVEVDLVPDPDPLLAERDWVVSADAVILDRCGRWVNLAGEIAAAHVPGAWVVDLAV